MLKVKAIIREDISDDEAIKVSFIENEKQKSYTSLDRVHGTAKLREQGKTQEEVAKLSGYSVRQIQRFDEIGRFPDVLKKAIANEKILAKHGFLLVQFQKKNPKLDLKKWVDIVEDKALSSEDLKKMLSKETRKVKKAKKFIEKRKEGFRLYPFAFNLKTTDKAEKKEMVKALKNALEMLEKA